MSFRLVLPEDLVEITHDGEPLSAERGQSLAHALIADGRLTLSRSPKLHRPRGPFCLSGACDGCLVRVNGTPNVAACRYLVQGGEQVETQNVLGSRELDLLQATDFLFPHGMDHHHLFAGVRGVSTLVTRLARRIAGLGRLPEEPCAERPSSTLTAPVVIVGGGAAGLSAAVELGSMAWVLESKPALGGAELLLDPSVSLERSAAASRAGARLLTNASAIAIYVHSPLTGEPSIDPRSELHFEVLVTRPSGMLRLQCSALVIANGGHAPAPSFGNGDLPGIFSARAGLELLRAGIVPGARVALVGEGPFTACVEQLLGERLAVRIEDVKAVEAAEGRTRVQALRYRQQGKLQQGKPRRDKVDAVFVEEPLSPSFELAVQAGANVRFEPKFGYVPRATPGSCVAPFVFCVGTASGVVGSADHQGREVGAHLRQQLSAR